MSSPRIDDRYELLDEKPYVPGGRLFRARDLAFAEPVGLKRLGAGCGAMPDERRGLEGCVRQVQCLTHPQIVRIHSLDFAAGILVQEWVPGVSLLDLLRRRRELTAAECFRLLDTLPALLDWLGEQAVPLPHPLLSRLYLQFEGNWAAESVVTLPLDQWPAFTLKLNALILRGHSDGTVVDETKATVFLDPREPGQVSGGYGPHELARLLYELLGGRMREVDNRRYSPLSALREPGNQVIRRSLFETPHTDCQSLWEELLAAEPAASRSRTQTVASLPAPRAVRIPEPFLAKAHPGSVLILQAEDKATPSIRLVARSRFTIGRSAKDADFVARVMPDNDANAALTNRLSRVHAVIERTPEGCFACDGSGSGASLNGSSLDHQRLSTDPVVQLPPRARLDLGAEYALELITLPSPLPRPWEIENITAWAGPSEMPAPSARGAIVAQPLGGQPPLRQTAWIFTEAGFSFNATGRLIWDTRLRGESPAVFHYHRGAFWLRNRSLPESALASGEYALQRDDIIPLFPGQVLRLGPHHFTVLIA